MNYDPVLLKKLQESLRPIEATLAKGCTIYLSHQQDPEMQYLVRKSLYSEHPGRRPAVATGPS